MTLNNILLIFALFISAHATGTSTEYQFASLSEIKEITQTDFGKNLLNTINIALDNEGNINSIQQLLQSLFSKLVDDQKKADIAWEKEDKRLKAKIASLRKKIAETKEKVEKLKDEKEKLIKLIITAKNNLKQYREQLNFNRQQIVHLKKTRAEDHADFLRSQAEHTDIINAIEIVVKELKTLVGSISGRGRPVHVSEISQEKRDAAYAKKNHSFLELSEETKKTLEQSFLEITQDEEEANIFVQMATEADQDALNKLINMLTKLRVSTIRSFNDDKNKEENSIRLYNKLLRRLESDINKLEKMIISQTNNLTKYEKRLAKVISEIATLEKLILALQAELNATIKEHQLKEKLYKEEKAQREEEMTVVQRLLKLVQKRLANMSAYLKGQVD